MGKQLTSVMLMMGLSQKLMDLSSVPLPGTPEPMTTAREPLGMNGSTTTSLASMLMESLLLSSDAVTKPDAETTTATPQENFTISSPPRAPRSSECPAKMDTTTSNPSQSVMTNSLDLCSTRTTKMICPLIVPRPGLPNSRKRDSLSKRDVMISILWKHYSQHP